ncbi:MAG TPA: hypothetical protein VGO57_10525 [Verrucomicrobiae bacterium]
MNLSILIPKWLAQRFARPKPSPVLRANLKQRQILPALPKNHQGVGRFQDDDSPPGRRLQWRL